MTDCEFYLPNLICWQVAAQTVAGFNPSVHITPIHGNIKEPQFDLDWFQSFDIVLNALDNLGQYYQTSAEYHLRNHAALIYRRT
jgi:molybdopterin/thiamine biosynthesis adenylyltransferase